MASREEVQEDNWNLVTRLADTRLVVSNRDEATGEETVEIVHEALIGGWDRLRQWVEADRAFRTWQERLRAALHQWEASNKDEGALLRGVLLAEAEQWQRERPDDLGRAEQNFVQASLELRDREQTQEAERKERELGLAQADRSSPAQRGEPVALSRRLAGPLPAGRRGLELLGHHPEPGGCRRTPAPRKPTRRLRETMGRSSRSSWPTLMPCGWPLKPTISYIPTAVLR